MLRWSGSKPLAGLLYLAVILHMRKQHLLRHVWGQTRDVGVCNRRPHANLSCAWDRLVEGEWLTVGRWSGGRDEDLPATSLCWDGLVLWGRLWIV